MRIIFAGTPDVAVPSLDALIETGYDVTTVLTREDARVGRRGTLTPSPVAEVAEARGVPVVKSNHLDDATVQRLTEFPADLGVIVAYGGLIREPLLTHPEHGWINLHFSRLPEWRGAAPVQRALMAGEQRIGITVFRLVEELDAGDVLTRDEYEFPPGTTSGDALSRLASYGTRAVESAITMLKQDPQAGTPQDGHTSYAHKLHRGDGKLDFTESADRVLAHWSGVTPEPGAYVHHEGTPLKITHLRSLTEDERSQVSVESFAQQLPGTALLHQKTPLIFTGPTASPSTLVLERVQPAGRGQMDGSSWLRGRGGKVQLT